MWGRSEGARRGRRALAAVSAVVLATGVGSGVGAGPAAGTGASGGGGIRPAASTIEQHYQAPGSWAVSERPATDPSGGAYTLFYPTDLGAGGVDHPILTWANGTGGSPQGVSFVLRHMASWGFVVVASNSGQTGYGTEVLAGARYMVAENANPSSIFRGHLDTSAVGSFGVSQGATGATWAALNSEGLIDTTVAISFVDPMWFGSPDQMPDFTQLDSSILFVTGALDILTLPWWQQAYYDRVPGPAAKASLAWAHHLTIAEPNNGFVGYITAWMRYMLEGDTYARGAFVGNPPEMNTNWSWLLQAQKNLP